MSQLIKVKKKIKKHYFINFLVEAIYFQFSPIYIRAAKSLKNLLRFPISLFCKTTHTFSNQIRWRPRRRTLARRSSFAALTASCSMWMSLWPLSLRRSSTWSRTIAPTTWFRSPTSPGRSSPRSLSTAKSTSTPPPRPLPPRLRTRLPPPTTNSRVSTPTSSKSIRPRCSTSFW